MPIEAQDISVGYSSSKLILEAESCCIQEGKMNVIIGKNGSGKSTLFKALCRQLALKEGSVFVDGVRMDKLKQTDLAKQIGMLFQENFAPAGLTVRELVSYGRYSHSKLMETLSREDWAAVDFALETTGASKFSSFDVSQLSSGQKQLAWIAMLVAQGAKYLFLDEPTTYLDLKNQFEVLDCLKTLNKDYGKTIVMILHDLNLAFQYADYVIMMKDWKIAGSGSAEDMLDEKLLSSLFDIQVKVIKASGKTYCIPSKD